MLKELVYPVIFRSSWQTEDKIRALFRHKLRESITELRDAKERELKSMYRNEIVRRTPISG